MNTLKEFIAVDSKLRKAIKQLIVIFVLLVFYVLTVCYIYFNEQKKSIIAEKQNDLRIITDLKVNQIANWRAERLSDALDISSRLAENCEARQILQNPDSEKRKKLFLSVLKHLKDNLEYSGFYLIDPSAKEVVSAHKKGEPPGDYSISLAVQSLKEDKITFSDLRRNEKTNGLDLDIYAPVKGRTPQGDIGLGILVLRLDPYQFLFPFIQSWPAPSKTFETLIVRKEGNKVLYLNELRHVKKAALSFEMPLDRKDLPAAMALRGIKGVIQGKDYRGVDVIAASGAIPDSPWTLIAKIDEDEIYEPIKDRAWIVSIAVFIFFIAIFALIGFLWNRHIAIFYRKQYESEIARRALVKRYDYLIKYANDIIILFDKDLKIIEANDKASEAYMYTNVELMQMTMRDLRAPESIPTIEDELKQLEEKGSIVFETAHRRKNGTRFPVEVSVRLIIIDWKEYYQSIIRDISPRKSKEK
ncbi:MAG: PAS domain S-box protein [Elusimicrobia bacterium]|nr:PAS domain S-box protein [Candidatus Liberimonas magnetica]